MPTIQDLAAQLVGEIPSLPFSFALKYTNLAIAEVRRAYLWSWNIAEGVLITPGIVTAGTVTVVRYSNEIKFDATAQASITPLLLANPPLIQRQFRIPGGPIYNIIGYDDSTGIATLDRIYTEASGESVYQIYRCYYDAPSQDGITPNQDFLRYLTINNPISGYTLTGRRLYLTREDLNRRDPLRGAQGLPYYAATYRPTPGGLFNGQQPAGPGAGIMQYELWPHPTNEQAYICQYERLHVDMAPVDYIPNQAYYTIFYHKAQEYSIRWAISNMGRLPELKGVNWALLLVDAQKNYIKELVNAKRNDKEILLSILRPGTSNVLNFFGPIDSNFLQSHAFPALW